MTKTLCCTTPGALCFWFAVFFVVYGAGLIGMALVPALRPFDETILLVALGVGCVVNFAVNRTYHCGITGPLFLAGAVLVGLDEGGVADVDSGLVWGGILLGLGAASLLEARFAWTSRSQA